MRRSVSLEKRADRSPTVGCDLGGTAIKAVLLSGPEVRASLELPTPRSASASTVISRLCEAVGQLRGATAGGRPGSLSGVGVAVPGFLDPERATVVRLSNVPALNGVRLKRELERRLRAPVALDTDTNAGAVGEALLGVGRVHERLLYVTLGTGLGAALTIGGRPVRVSRHTVGQVAHVPLVESGRRCGCGARTCAEAQLCARGIVWRARKLGVRPVASPRDLWHLATGGPDDVTPELRRLARGAWRETGELLGQLCLLVASLVSPEGIVVGGGISEAAPLFLPSTRRLLDRHLPRRLGHPVAVEPAALSPHSGAIGAALLARASG